MLILSIAWPFGRPIYGYICAKPGRNFAMKHGTSVQATLVFHYESHLIASFWLLAERSGGIGRADGKFDVLRAMNVHRWLGQYRSNLSKCAIASEHSPTNLSKGNNTESQYFPFPFFFSISHMRKNALLEVKIVFIRHACLFYHLDTIEEETGWLAEPTSLHL